MDNKLQKQLAIIQELETSFKLVKLGIGEYQNLGGANDFYYLPFQLISSGLERLMKCHVCLGYLEQNGDFPDFKYIKKLGHDLIKLKEHILNNFYSTENRPALERDLNYLQSHSDLSKVIFILSEFGKYARYYNLDIITNSTQPSIDAKSEWEQFEIELVLRDCNLTDKLGKIEYSEEIYETVKRVIIIHIEKFTRAICRQFTLGGLGEKAKQLSPIIFDFIILKDEDLGNKNYRESTTRYSSNKETPHKRNILDEFERKTNKKFASKRVLKNEFNGDWPFYAEEITIECRDQHWCIVTINGFDYALNGAAKGRYKLEGVFDAGMAILGKSIGPFIDMALELGKK